MSLRKDSKVYIEYLKKKHDDLTYNPYLREFEQLNTTTESIYDLEGHKVLIILKDGTNLTSWYDVENKNDVIYVSEDLSKYIHLSRKYYGLRCLRAIVITDFSNNAVDADFMFSYCESLVEMSCLKDWDVSSLKSMKGMFDACKSLSDISFLKDWDVSNVRWMDNMFSGCRKISDLEALKDWDISCAESMNYMFYGCKSIDDISHLSRWDVSHVGYMNWMFCGCDKLVSLKGLKDWSVNRFLEVDYMFFGCESLADASDADEWNITQRMRNVFYGCKSLKEIPKWYNSRYDGF